MSRSTPPNVGRIVHYRGYGGERGGEPTPCRAAIVVEVPDREGYSDHNDEVCDLVVFSAIGTSHHRSAHVEPGGYTEAQERGVRLGLGTWHWPEHVEPEGLVRESPVPDPLARGGMIDRPPRTPDSTIGGAP